MPDEIYPSITKESADQVALGFMVNDIGKLIVNAMPCSSERGKKMQDYYLNELDRIANQIINESKELLDGNEH